MLRRTNAIPSASLTSLILIVSLFLIPTNSVAQNVIDATEPENIVEAPGVFLKRKVGIARFSNETQSGTSFLVDNSGDRLGKRLTS